MNSELHIVGSRYGLELIPNDGLDKEVRCCTTLHKGEETLVVSLSSEIVHYVYLHHIGPKGSKDFFGFVMSFNGVCFRSTKCAFEIFERIYETSVYEGLLIHVADNGQIVFDTLPFHEQKAQCQRIEQTARNLVDTLPRSSFVVQPRTYRVGNGEIRVNLSAGDAYMAECITKFDRVAIERELSHSGVNDMQSRLRMLHEQSKDWEKKYQEEHKKKKQYSLVVVLLLVLLIGGAVATYVIRDNLFRIDNLTEKVHQQKQMISERNLTIKHQERQICDLEDAITERNKQVEALSDSVYKIRSYARMRHRTGLPPMSGSGYDNGYIMWLYADAPITIDVLRMCADKSGSIRVVLRDEYGYLVDEYYADVRPGFCKYYVDLDIPNPGYYSLGVENTGNINFQYTKTDKTIYDAFGGGALRILGCCSRGNGYSSAGYGFYQYFYNIQYHVTI